MIHVIARLSLNPGAREKWLAEFRKVQPEVHAEEGCIAYDATADEPGVLGAQTLAGADTVIIVERWRDAAALRAHSTAPHMTAYRAATRPYVAGTVIEVLKPL